MCHRHQQRCNCWGDACEVVPLVTSWKWRAGTICWIFGTSISHCIPYHIPLHPHNCWSDTHLADLPLSPNISYPPLTQCGLLETPPSGSCFFPIHLHLHQNIQLLSLMTPDDKSKLSFGGIPNGRNVLFSQVFLKRAAKPSAGNASAGFPWVKWPQIQLNLTWLCDILTSKCVSRHNGVHVFNISTSKKCSKNVVFCTFWLGSLTSQGSGPKSAPKLNCFVIVCLDMCFAPQRRALFRQPDFQKCSDLEVFLAFFYLPNVLRATTAFGQQADALVCQNMSEVDIS